MRTTYHKSRVGDLSVTEARVLASFYGVGAELTAKVFAYEDVGGMRLELRPVPRGAGHLLDIAYNGILRFPEQDDRGRRMVEQRVELKGVVTEVQPFARFRNAAEGEARVVCQQFFLKFEAIAEFVRRQIVESFAPAFRARGPAALDARYGPAARETARLLSTLNWPLLLAEVQAPNVFRDVIDYVMTHNHPRYFPVAEGNPEAAPLAGNDYGDVGDLVQTVHAQRAAAARAAKQAEANAKASALLRMVCGQEHYDHFQAKGCVVVEKDGWTFRLKPGAFVDCLDPQGRKGRLCIHTVALSCNPIDEIVLAYLHIRHKFDEYMATAIVHGCERGFSLAQFKQKAQKAREAEKRQGQHAQQAARQQ
jgi:hypothetical protein